MTFRWKSRMWCLTLSVLVVLLAANSAFGADEKTEDFGTEAFGLGLDRMDPALYRSRLREMPRESFHRGHFDWRDQGKVTPAENQGMCGGCWAFAINGAIESQMLIEYGLELDLSDQFLLACSAEGAGCCGGSIDFFSFYYDVEPRYEADQPFMEYWVACSSLTCPDECTSYPCDTSGPTVGTTLVNDSLFTVDVTDFNAITNAVFAHGPLALSYAVHQDFRTYWSQPAGSGSWPDGVYTNLTEDYRGGHGVLVIGYDTDAEYLICKNSWGESAGPFGDGTFKFSFAGHESADVLWGLALAELQSSPHTPTPTPTLTPTPTPPPNDDCSSVEIYNVGQCVCDLIDGASNRFDCSWQSYHSGEDRVYRIMNFSPGSIYHFRAETEFDADWAISTYCATDDADILCDTWFGDNIEVSCRGAWTPEYQGELDFELLAEEPYYYIWVDSYRAGSYGEYCFEVECIATATPTPLPTTIYVPDNYATINEAITGARQYDTIVLRDGIYTGSSNTNLNFQGKNLVLKSENGSENTIIDGENTYRGIVFNSGETNDSAVQGITFRNCSATAGAAITCTSASPIIANCRFISNSASGSGGALSLYNADMWIGGCEFWYNTAGDDGGAAFSEEGSPYFVNCLFKSNFATDLGGALAFDRNGSPYLRNITTYTNSTDNEAGGIVAMWNVDLSIQNSILWYDDPGELMEINGSITVSFSDIYEGWPGSSNINISPEFITGPQGDYYLDQLNSPCVDGGARPASMIYYYTEPGTTVSLDTLTTSTVLTQDTGMADMGYHYQTSIPPTAVPTWTPSPTPTATFTPSPTSTPTNTPVPITPEPTNTPASGIINVPGDFGTIQAAVNAALPGATVVVADGTWTGVGNREINVSKSITIRSNGDPEACVIDCQAQGNAFRIHDSQAVGAVIDGFTITNGLADYYGGAFEINDTTVTVSNCIVMANSASEGAGFTVFNSTVTMMGCQVLNNACVAESYERGSGLLGLNADVTIDNCLFAGNSAKIGGAITISNTVSRLTMRNSTIANNTYDDYGVSGVWLDNMGDSTIENCIVYGNEGTQVEFTDVTVTISHSMIEGTTIWPGTGNINMDPLFVAGPGGNYYLFDEAAAQSPCIDTGSQASTLVCYDAMAHVCLDERTTHIHGLQDDGTVDMGFHYLPVAQPTFTPPPTPTTACVRDGDVDFNGTVTAGDAQLVFNFVLGIATPTTEQTCASDCNGDGSITAADSQQIFFSVLGMGSCVD